MMAILLYLHGFNSSPASTKAVRLKQWLLAHHPTVTMLVPQIASSPKRVAAFLANLVEQHMSQRLGLVGASLGGYYATWLSQRYRLPAVVINPVVYSDELRKNFLGSHYHLPTGEYYTVSASHLEELKALQVNPLVAPNLLWLLQQKADEVLDYRLALDYYRPCRQHVEAGGNHAFTQLERFFPHIVDFLALNPSNTATPSPVPND